MNLRFANRFKLTFKFKWNIPKNYSVSLSSGAKVKWCSLTPVRKGYKNHNLYNKHLHRKWCWTAVGMNCVGGWCHTWKRWSWAFGDFQINRAKVDRWSAQVVFSDLIKADQFESRPTEMSWDLIHCKMCRAHARARVCVCGGGQHSMLSICFYDLCLSSGVAKDWK